MKKYIAIIAAVLMAVMLCACGQKEPQIVEVPVEVEKIVEVPVETEKIVEVPVEVEKIVEVPVEVEKIIEVPVETEKIVEVPVEVEKIVEVPVEVEKIIEVPVEVEKIVEVPVEVEKIVEVEVPVETTETVFVEDRYVFSRSDEFEAAGVNIPEDFVASFEDGTPVELFAYGSYSVLRSHPDTDRNHILGYIYYSQSTSEANTFIAYPKNATCFGIYKGYALIEYNGSRGWVKETGLNVWGAVSGVTYTLSDKD